MAAESPRVVLVETSEALPGLLPFQAWDELGTAEVIYLRDVERHPYAEHLHFAGLDLETLEPATLERGDLDLTQPGDPVDRRLAKALLDRADQAGRVVYLLGADDRRLPPVLGSMAPARDAEIELVFLAQEPEGAELVTLVRTMRRLRDPDHGCPWDLEQDHASLVGNLVEESYELIEAIEAADDDEIREELGDVLLQVVFHAQIARDRKAFAIDDVARAITEKLVRRHPHVFADTEVADAAEVKRNWDAIKAEEKDRDGPFDGVPQAMPGLALLSKLQNRAAKRGFDWSRLEGPADKVSEELDEVLAETDAERREAELGDLLGAVVSLARHLGVDPESAARTHARAFRGRVEAAIADLEARGIDEPDADAWLAAWRRARDAEAAAGSAAHPGTDDAER